MTLREQLIADQRARIAQLKEEGLPADSLMVEEADLVRAEAGSDHIMNIERYGDLEVIGMRRFISERTDPGVPPIVLFNCRPDILVLMFTRLCDWEENWTGRYRSSTELVRVYGSWSRSPTPETE